MNPQIQHLIDLQETDCEIGDLKKWLKVIPEQIKKSRDHLTLEKERLDNLHAEIQALRKKRSRLEQEAQAENDHMAKIKGKLPSVKTNKEYSALLAEVDAVKGKITSIEDEELRVMEALEEKEKDVPRLESSYDEEERQFQEIKKKKEAELTRVEEDLKSLGGKRRDIMSLLEQKWAVHYEKVAKLRGDRVVVSLEDGACQGCHQQIRPQQAIEVKMGETVFHCTHCYRFVYWAGAPDAETVAPK